MEKRILQYCLLAKGYSPTLEIGLLLLLLKFGSRGNLVYAKAKILLETGQITPACLSVLSLRCSAKGDWRPDHHLKLKKALQVGEFQNHRDTQLH